MHMCARCGINLQRKTRTGFSEAPGPSPVQKSPGFYRTCLLRQPALRMLFDGKELEESCQVKDLFDIFIDMADLHTAPAAFHLLVPGQNDPQAA